MSDFDCKQVVLQALSQMRGDDLYRARLAFRGMTFLEMKEQHGASGKSRAEILAEYEAWELKIDRAEAWVKGK